MAEKTEKKQPTLNEIFTKRGKLTLDMLRASEEAKAAFVALAQSIPGLEDWSEKAPEYFTTVALVQPEGDAKAPRLIGISDKEHVFSDPIVSTRLYQAYVSRVTSAAVKDEADPADFVLVAGTYRQAHDMSAFQAQAAGMVNALKQKGITGMTVKNLRMCLENAAYARSTFPRITDQSWDFIIGLMVQNATERGLDTSIFAHWQSTRQVKIDTGTAIDMSDFAKIVHEKLAEKDETEQPTETVQTVAGETASVSVPA